MKDWVVVEMQGRKMEEGGSEGWRDGADSRVVFYIIYD